MKKRKKLLITLAVLTALAAVSLLCFDFPKKISVQYPAVEYDQNGTPVPTTVSVNGTYRRPLLRDPSFRGKIVCGEYAFTEESDLIGFQFLKSWGGTGYLVYSSVRDGAPSLEQFASIRVSGDFDEVALRIHDPELLQKRGAKTLTLCAPANNPVEAEKIAEKLPEKSK